MISSDKILYHLYENQKNDLKPITADVFITDYCNNKCPLCTFERYGKHNNKYMTFEHFKEYASRLIELGIKGIILTGGGEPTLNPDFDLICSWLNKNNINYGVNTNFNIYKEINPVYLKVSLDAWDKQSYIDLRGVDRYEQVINNIKNYSNYKIQNQLNTQLGVQCIVSDLEIIPKFYESIKDLSIDYIIFRPVESILGQYYTDINLSTYLKDLNIILDSLIKIDSRVKRSFKWDELNTRFDYCYANWSQLALDVDGNVLVCCHRPYDIIGHIIESDILAKKEQFKIDCSTCDMPCRLTGSNKIIKNLNNMKTITDKDFI